MNIQSLQERQKNVLRKSSLNELGYSHVIAELDAHSKTLGVDEIVDSDFGMMIRSVIEWELEEN